MHFFHDFDGTYPLKNQLGEVKEKYHRRITRFYKDIKQLTLFIRYVKNQAELDYVNKNYERISRLLKKYNHCNELLLIANDVIINKNQKVFFVSKDENDSVAREFLENNSKLKEYLTSVEIFDYLERQRNLLRYKNKRKPIKILVIISKLFKRFRKKYTHYLTI